MKTISFDELEKLLKQSKAGVIPYILKDLRKNPQNYEKYLTMSYPVVEILCDWA